ncbi:MAG: right-handed parallel beta-helix repeat-containing protein, partial [Mesorhizobium sp.]
MKKLGYILSSILFGMIMACLATPASAQATRTWVSGVGDDV